MVDHGRRRPWTRRPSMLGARARRSCAAGTAAAVFFATDGLQIDRVDRRERRQPRVNVAELLFEVLAVLGAAAGAATNYAYTRYYQDMAHVHFGLRRLAIEADRDMGEMVVLFRERAGEGRVTRG